MKLLSGSSTEGHRRVSKGEEIAGLHTRFKNLDFHPLVAFTTFRGRIRSDRILFPVAYCYHTFVIDSPFYQVSGYFPGTGLADFHTHIAIGNGVGMPTDFDFDHRIITHESEEFVQDFSIFLTELMAICFKLQMF